MTAYARLADQINDRKLVLQLFRVGGTLELRCYDPKMKKTLAKQAFDPQKPDEAAIKLGEQLLAFDI